MLVDKKIAYHTWIDSIPFWRLFILCLLSICIFI